MRWALVGTLSVSLLAHGAVAAFLLMPPRGGLPPAEADPPPESSGETFLLPAPQSAEVPLANAAPAPDTNAASAAIEFPDAPARPVPPSHAKPGARPSHQGRPSAGRAAPGQTDGSAASAGSTALYGAIGDRSAADLTRAFTRAFPQAASGDPVWRTVPLGAAGEATLVLTLDDTGHITDVQVVGSPSPALAEGIKRTMALIKNRPFTARGKITKLRLSATVTPNTVPDGLHGDVFAIGAGADDGFFALAVGRRIDLRVRAQ